MNRILKSAQKKHGDVTSHSKAGQQFSKYIHKTVHRGLANADLTPTEKLTQGEITGKRRKFAKKQYKNNPAYRN